MANLRLIKIVRLDSGTTVFQPATLGVDPSDTIHWNNETDEDHWLERKPTGFVTNTIRAGDVSNPGFVVAESIDYRCKLHPQEQGTLVVPTVAVATVVVPAGSPAVTAVAAPAATEPSPAEKNEA